MMLSLCTGYAAPLPEKLRVEVSSDPSHFTIGVNMQHPSLAEQYAAAGINQFVGRGAGRGVGRAGRGAGLPERPARSVSAR